MSKASISVSQRLVKRYTDLSSARPWTVIAFFLLLSIPLLLSISKLKLDTQLQALLPENTHSQQANRESNERYAGSSPYFLVVQSPDAEFNRKISDRALEEVRKWPETVWAMNARDPKFLLDRRLLFVNEPALAQFTAEVERYVAFRKCEKMPGCFQLDDEPEEPSFEALQEELSKQPEVMSLSALFSGDALNDALSSAKVEGDESGRLCSVDGTVCVVQATLTKEPTDLGFAKDMVEKGEALLHRLTAADAPKNTITAVAGIYRNLPLTRAALMEDLTRTFGLGLLLMVAIIMFQFRKPRAILLLLIPLAVGSVWALGIFAWISPELNLISAAGFIILAGLGIDFGLHLLTHYGALRTDGQSPEEAMEGTMSELISSLSVAALTTVCGFSALIAAAFRGFAQLGLFASVGIFCTLASALLIFPPLVIGLNRLVPTRDSLTRVWKMPRFLSWGFPAPSSWMIGTAGLAFLLASFYFVPKMALRYDLTPLIDKAKDETHFRDALAGTSRGAVLLLADDQKSLEEAAAGIRDLYPNGLSGPRKNETASDQDVPEAKGAPLITLGTFLPPDQDKKLEHIAVLSKAADEAMRFSDDAWKDKLRPWIPMLEVTDPLTQSELPEWVVQSLTERDGKVGTVGLTYQDYPGEDAAKMLILSEKLDVLRERYPKVRFASSSAVLGEVMPLLRKDGWRVTGLALLGTLIATLLIGRSRRRTLLILTTILLAVGVTASLMVVLDFRVDFYNMLVFPVVFGIGVDGAIYVVWTVLKRAGQFDWTHLPVSARAVFGSTMTTLAMFLSLSTSENGGLASLGTVGSIALVVTLVANLIWLPAALSWLQQFINRKRPSETAPHLEESYESRDEPLLSD